MNKQNLNGAGHRSSNRRGLSDVDRRTSRRRSDVRHGRIYENTTDNTIRAVTPDSGGSASFDITALPSPLSFDLHDADHMQPQATPASVSNTDEESTTEGRKRKTKKKSRYNDSAPSDTSPNSFFEKTRKRLNSITTSPSIPSRHDDSSLSIGFPSVVQASVFPDLQEMRHNLPIPRRTISSDTAVSATMSIKSPLPSESDSDKILKLMKTLCGRMHGILFYRPIGTTAWHSGYCAINVAPGSLVCQTRGVVTQQDVLIADLRGCTVRTHYDSQAQSTHLSVVLPVSGFGYQLRPSVPETFESWLAALLCWQPLKPKGIHDKMAKPQSISIADKSSLGSRRVSDITGPRSTAVVKSSQMLLWDGALSAGVSRHQAKRIKLGSQERGDSWRRVNCTLHENGILRLLAEESAMSIRSMKLNTLARCAIQRLDASVLGAANCIAIHPQYTAGATKATVLAPVVLCLASRVAFEAWFVLLQAMTVPELYGPERNAALTGANESSDDTTDQTAQMFRIERSLHVKIIEAKIAEDERWRIRPHQQNTRLDRRAGDRQGADIYAEVLLGRDLRARTTNRPLSHAMFWAQEFCLLDIPSMLSRLSIVLRTENQDEREWTMTTKGNYDLCTDEETPDFEAIEVASHDPIYGRVEVPLLELEQDHFIEKWWPLVDGNGGLIGQALIKLSLEESIVLMTAEYMELSALLHNFDNSVTSQIGQQLGIELKQLAEVLLDVFQSTGKVEDWINNLVEEEIDGIYRDQPPTQKMRFSGRIHSNDSYERVEQREALVRDLSRSATMEANLLFRGNSLVTKALDAHMRRLGREYLEQTLGEALRHIVVTDPDCEVDPNKVRSVEQLERNWSTLIKLTSSIWRSISISASACPAGMRNVLKHVKACAEDRYESFIRTAKYTSVSGFLFLRFFCPAILNPKLFGLLDDNPPDRSRRTFTLIAKSLIVLANLSKFGQKEPWMEPMNKFLAVAAPEFKGFIEDICSWNAPEGIHHEPQYQAAAQVKLRLPLMSREGLPSLPFLLDLPRSLANLVDIWTANAPPSIAHVGAEECLQRFHKMCVGLKQKTRDCMAKAEMAQEPNSMLERQWQTMLGEQPKGQLSSSLFDEMQAEKEITALPQSPESWKHNSRYLVGSSDDQGNGISQGTAEKEEVDSPYEPPGRTMTSSTNSSSASFEVFNDHRSRKGLTSREGSARGRFFENSKQWRGRGETVPGKDTNRI